MSSRSFFEEQRVRHQATWVYLVLGTVWMAAMGFLVVAVNVVFFNNAGLLGAPFV